MAAVTEAQIRDALRAIPAPDGGGDIVARGMMHRAGAEERQCRLLDRGRSRRGTDSSSPCARPPRRRSSSSARHPVGHGAC